jgi:hypothetical protein
MKFYRSIPICLVLIAGSIADGCFAQTAINPQESVADSSAPPVPAVALPSVAPVASVFPGKTREQVTRELEDFQHSGQAAQMLELYKGGS